MNANSKKSQNTKKTLHLTYRMRTKKRHKSRENENIVKKTQTNAIQNLYVYSVEYGEQTTKNKREKRSKIYATLINTQMVDSIKKKRKTQLFWAFIKIPSVHFEFDRNLTLRAS